MSKQLEESKIDHNRKILKTYSREKLIEFINDFATGVYFGGKNPEDMNRDELIDTALALIGGE